MTDTETAPDFTPIKRPRRVPATEPAVAPDQPAEPAEPPTETGADTAATAGPTVPVATEPAPAAETPVAATRRGKRDASTAAVTVPWESSLPGVRSSEIRAELARRQQRVPTLLAERALVIQQMEAIEDALESIGEELPEAVRLSQPPVSSRRFGSGASLDGSSVAIKPFLLASSRE